MAISGGRTAPTSTVSDVRERVEVAQKAEGGRISDIKSTVNPLAGLLATLSMIQGITGAFTQFQEGKAKRALLKTDRRLALMEAEDAKKRGQEEEAIARGETKKLVGTQRAAFAAQGVRLDVGSPQDITQETQDIGELDALAIKNSARREAFGFETKARGFEAEAKQVPRATRFKAGTTFLTGAGKALRTFEKGQ